MCAALDFCPLPNCHTITVGLLNAKTQVSVLKANGLGRQVEFESYQEDLNWVLEGPTLPQDISASGARYFLIKINVKG